MWRSCIAAGHKAVQHADPALFSGLLGPVGRASAAEPTSFGTLAGMPSAPDLRVLVVLPAWNEAASLPAVLNEIHSHLPDVGVVVVNDGSADATSAVARAHGAQVLDLP